MFVVFLDSPLKMSRLNRSDSYCPILGFPSLLPNAKLPTSAQVLRCFYQHQFAYRLLAGKFPNKNDIATTVAREVKTRWTQSTIPSLSEQEVQRKVCKLVDEFKKVNQKFKRLEQSPEDQEQHLKNYLKTIEGVLFEVPACRCTDFDKCVCPVAYRIPKEEQAFIADQRDPKGRKGRIGPVDRKTSQKMRRKEEEAEQQPLKKKKLADSQFNKSLPSTSGSLYIDEPANDSEGDEQFEQDESDPDVCSEESSGEEYEVSHPGNRTSQNRMEIIPFALECLRGGVSTRVAARLFTSALLCVGIVSPEDRTLVVDRSKVERALNKALDYCKIRAKEKQTPLVCLSFDGRRDYTRAYLEQAGLKQPDTVREEHVVLVQQPGNVYLGHITTKVS
jgi:hypothetical protein